MNFKSFLIENLTHYIGTSLKPGEVTRLKKESKADGLIISIVPMPGGHNDSSNSSYFMICASKEDLEAVCSIAADRIGFFDETDIKVLPKSPHPIYKD